MSPNVFICHADPDREKAQIICAALEVAGMACWIAPRDLAPDRPADSLIDAITRCRTVILLVSANANCSEAVERQMQLAIATDTRVCPIKVDDVPLGESMVLLTGSVQWLDAFTPPIEQHLDSIADVSRRCHALTTSKAGGMPASPVNLTTSDGPLSLDPGAMSKLRLEQANAISQHSNELRNSQSQFTGLLAQAEARRAQKNLTAAALTLEEAARLRPWDRTVAQIRAEIDAQPLRVSKSAVVSLVFALGSVGFGAVLYLAMSAMPTVFSDWQAEVYPFFLWLVAAVFGGVLGFGSLRTIRRRPRDFFGKTIARIGVGFSLAMVVGCLVVMITDDLAGFSDVPVNQHYQTAMNLKQQNKLDEAIAEYTLALEKNPKLVDALYERGCIYWINKKDYPKALADLNKAIAINPHYPPSFWARGNVYHEQAELARALADFNECIRLRGSDAFYGDYEDRARVFVAKGEYQRAIDDDSTALKCLSGSQTDERLRLLLHRAKVYRTQGNVNAAEANEKWAKQLADAPK